MQVTTHGNRHRLTIEAAAKDGNTYHLDSATANEFGPAWTDLCVRFKDGTLMPIATDWQIVAALMAKALRDGHCQPRHIQRVPAWGKLPYRYQMAVLKAFSPKPSLPTLAVALLEADTY